MIVTALSGRFCVSSRLYSAIVTALSGHLGFTDRLCSICDSSFWTFFFLRQW